MTIYEQALEIINSAKRISGNIAVYTNCTKAIFIRQSNYQLYLVYQSQSKTEQVKCGFYSPNRGWIFSLDYDRYLAWVAKTGNEVQPKTIIQPLAEWANTPGGQEYMDLPDETPGLAEEWADHHRARTAGRNAGQPRWDGWRRVPQRS